MYVVVDGEYSDWNLIGYTETKEQAMSICAWHNHHLKDKWAYEWYCIHALPITAQFPEIQGLYSFSVVFKPDKSFSYCKRNTIYPNVYHEPMIVQEDEYCYVVNVMAESNAKATKIGKDALMKILAEREGI